MGKYSYLNEALDKVWVDNVGFFNFELFVDSKTITQNPTFRFVIDETHPLYCENSNRILTKLPHDDKEHVNYMFYGDTIFAIEDDCMVVTYGTLTKPKLRTLCIMFKDTATVDNLLSLIEFFGNYKQ